MNIATLFMRGLHCYTTTGKGEGNISHNCMVKLTTLAFISYNQQLQIPILTKYTSSKPAFVPRQEPDDSNKKIRMQKKIIRTEPVNALLARTV